MAVHTRLIYEFDDFQLEPDGRQLLRRGQLIPLHGKAFEMLLVLIRNHGRLLTKDELFQLVWPDQIVEESNLTVNMSAIRRALGERASNPRYITTVSGRGYRFSGQVRHVPVEALTIEREMFARLVVEEEEIEASTLVLSAKQFANILRRLTSHPFVLVAICASVLVIGGVSFLMRGLHGTTAAPLPWTNVTLHRFVTHGGVPFRVTISPDGKSLVYRQRLNGKDTLWLGQIDSNSSVPISDRTDIFYQSLAFSPDGGNLYLTVRDPNQLQNKLVRMPVVGGVMTDLIENISGPVTFSPDGNYFAFIRRDGRAKQTSIVIADAADGKNERVLVARKAPDDFTSAGLSWSPDGKTIAIGANTNDHTQTGLVTINVAKGALETIGSRAWGVVGNIAWSPDGAGILIATRESPVARRGQIWFVPYPKGEARKVTNDLNIYLTDNLSAAANGKVAVLQGHLTSEILIAPGGDFSQSRLVFRGVEPSYEGVDGLAWSPDGHLLYTAYVGDGQGIWEIGNEGSTLRQLTTPNAADSVDRQMVMTRDGRYLVFQSNRSGRFQIWRANADGGDLRQLTSGGENTQPTLSADGRWIIYVSETDGRSILRRISINGGESTQLTDRKPAAPEVSPDGKYIAYFESLSGQPIRLAIIPFAGGESLKTFAVPPSVVLVRRMSWTPDSKSIIYKDSIQGLWQQRLDQEKLQSARGFENTEVYQLAWSFDGRNLAYSTGMRMQDIILLENSR
jgi:Tol biopolymer transport system component/DNA-binding winged helix-turn-helix (wHTH) protein